MSSQSSCSGSPSSGYSSSGSLSSESSSSGSLVELGLVELVELGVDELGPVEFRLIELDDTQSILSPSSVIRQHSISVQLIFSTQYLLHSIPPSMSTQSTLRTAGTVLLRCFAIYT